MSVHLVLFLAFGAVCVAGAVNLLAQTRDPFTRLDVVRLLILALGDWHLNNPAIEVNTGYEFPTPPANEFDVPALRHAVRSLIPSRNELLDAESARLLAMLEDDDKRTPALLVNSITQASTASSDFHYLACLARVRATAPELSARIAAATLGLDRKLRGQEMRVKQNWNTRLVEVVQQLIRREPSIADALLRHPHFATAPRFPGGRFEGEKNSQRRFLAVAKAATAFPWTSDACRCLDVTRGRRGAVISPPLEQLRCPRRNVVHLRRRTSRPTATNS
jgi:hypothetical protein